MDMLTRVERSDRASRANRAKNRAGGQIGRRRARFYGVKIGQSRAIGQISAPGKIVGARKEKWHLMGFKY